MLDSTDDRFDDHFDGYNDATDEKMQSFKKKEDLSLKKNFAVQNCR